jgi:hypothetical protein
MLEFFEKYSESSFRYKDKRAWPIILKTSKKVILKTIKEVFLDYGFVNLVINEDFGECFCINGDCEITITLLNNGPNVEINLAVFSDKFGKTFRKLKQVNELLSTLFEGFQIC